MSAFPVPENHDHWWLVTGEWARLHAIPGDAIDRLDEAAFEALCDYPGPEHRAVCGTVRRWNFPGVFTRLAAPRCAHCCDRLNISRGDGTPLNEAAEQCRAADSSGPHGGEEIYPGSIAETEAAMEAWIERHGEEDQ